MKILLEKIISNFQKMPIDDKLYLVASISKTSGFFAHEGKLVFLLQNVDELKFESIETEYLSLRTNVHIHSVENCNTYSDDYYNLIIFKGTPKDDNIFSFIKLCLVYSNSIKELTFREFFYSLISLFQLPKEQSFKNALGLYGELKFIQSIWTAFKIDISKYWHKSGSYSKYDFSNTNCNVEIKSVLSEEMIVQIKHSQIFDEPCYLCVVNCEKNENGESIQDLLEWFYQEDEAFKNVNFAIALQRELKRISTDDIISVRFSLLKLSVYSSLKIRPFDIVPDRLSNLCYDYDLVDIKPINQEELHELLK